MNGCSSNQKANAPTVRTVLNLPSSVFSFALSFLAIEEIFEGPLLVSKRFNNVARLALEHKDTFDTEEDFVSNRKRTAIRVYRILARISRFIADRKQREDHGATSSKSSSNTKKSRRSSNSTTTGDASSEDASGNSMNNKSSTTMMIHSAAVPCPTKITKLKLINVEKLSEAMLERIIELLPQDLVEIDIRMDSAGPTVLTPSIAERIAARFPALKTLSLPDSDRIMVDYTSLLPLFKQYTKSLRTLRLSGIKLCWLFGNRDDEEATDLHLDNIEELVFDFGSIDTRSDLFQRLLKVFPNGNWKQLTLFGVDYDELSSILTPRQHGIPAIRDTTATVAVTPDTIRLEELVVIDSPMNTLPNLKFCPLLKTIELENISLGDADISELLHICVNLENFVLKDAPYVGGGFIVDMLQHPRLKNAGVEIPRDRVTYLTFKDTVLQYLDSQSMVVNGHSGTESQQQEEQQQAGSYDALESNLKGLSLRIPASYARAIVLMISKSPAARSIEKLNLYCSSFAYYRDCEAMCLDDDDKFRATYGRQGKSIRFPKLRALKVAQHPSLFGQLHEPFKSSPPDIMFTPLPDGITLANIVNGSPRLEKLKLEDTLKLDDAPREQDFKLQEPHSTIFRACFLGQVAAAQSQSCSDIVPVVSPLSNVKNLRLKGIGLRGPELRSLLERCHREMRAIQIETNCYMDDEGVRATVTVPKPNSLQLLEFVDDDLRYKEQAYGRNLFRPKMETYRMIVDLQPRSFYYLILDEHCSDMTGESVISLCEAIKQKNMELGSLTIQVTRSVTLDVVVTVLQLLKHCLLNLDLVCDRFTDETIKKLFYSLPHLEALEITGEHEFSPDIMRELFTHAKRLKDMYIAGNYYRLDKRGIKRKIAKEAKYDYCVRYDSDSDDDAGDDDEEEEEEPDVTALDFNKTTGGGDEDDEEDDEDGDEEQSQADDEEEHK